MPTIYWRDVLLEETTKVFGVGFLEGLVKVEKVMDSIVVRFFNHALQQEFNQCNNVFVLAYLMSKNKINKVYV